MLQQLLIIVIIQVIILTIKSSVVIQMVQSPKIFNSHGMKSSVLSCCRSSQQQIFDIFTEKKPKQIPEVSINHLHKCLPHSE